MDINAGSDVKVYGMPAVAVAEVDESQRQPVKPVAEVSDAVTVEFNEQSLRGRGQEEEKGTYSQEDIEEAVEHISEQIEVMGGHSKFGFHIHRESDSVVAQLRDKVTNEVIKQFPAEEILQLRANLQDLVGLLFDRKA